MEHVPLGMSRVWLYFSNDANQVQCGNASDIFSKPTPRRLKHDNMSNVAGFVPESLSEGELRKLLIDALENAPGDQNPETYHAPFDHLERGITVDDVIHGIEGIWTYQKPPKFNQDHWQWKYFLSAKTIDDDDLTIIVAVDTAYRRFEVITRWIPEGSR
jgi:hypothetical protein